MHMFFFFVALLLLPIVASGQTVFFKADAESGTVKPPWDEIFSTSTVSNSTTAAKTGSRSFKFTNAGGENDAKVIIYGSGRANLLEGYYSAWYYIGAGYNDTKWRNNMQWKVNNDSSYVTIPGTVKITSGFTMRNSIRQWVVNIALCKVEPCTRFQPNPIPIPLQQWVHIETYVKVAQFPNGVITVWQDGKQIYHITGINTLTTLDKNGSGKESNNRYLYYGIGSYIDPTVTGEQTVYADDAMITNYRVFPTLQSPTQTTPNNLRIVEN